MSPRTQHRLARWPPFLSRWLGYRAMPPPKNPQYIVWLWSFIGAFCGISAIQALFGQAHYFISRGVPSIVASFGASAVLIYGTIDAPLAQPRALLGGHFIGALLGVCIAKLFQLLPEERFLQLEWLAGSLACATAIVAMQITGTTHPPAGATALLAVTNSDIRDLSWYFLPVVLLTSTLALVIALLLNNIQRRYPVFWFHPAVSIPAPVSPELGGPETSTLTLNATNFRGPETSTVTLNGNNFRGPEASTVTLNGSKFRGPEASTVTLNGSKSRGPKASTLTLNGSNVNMIIPKPDEVIDISSPV